MLKGLDCIEKILYPIDENKIKSLKVGEKTVFAYFDVIKVKDAVYMLKEMIRHNEMITIEQMEEMLDLVNKSFPIFDTEDIIH